MEADTSQDLQGEAASWRAQSNGVVLVQRLPDTGSQYSSSSLKAEKHQCPSSKAVRQEKASLTQRKVNLFVPLRPSTDCVSPQTLGRAVLFTQSADLNVNAI